MNQTGKQAFMSQLKADNLRQLAMSWILLPIVIGALIGSASALFLFTLDAATTFRESNIWLIVFLPLSGLLIGLLYHFCGNSVVKGNNLILEEFHHPKKVIPFKMAPLVFVGTILTHLFGGSAGREGTALQMGGAIADQFTAFFKRHPIDRKILLVIGISGGFASVFGTPLAGALFALEILVLSKKHYTVIVPSFLAAYCAHFTCLAWNISHTSCFIPDVPQLTIKSILWVVCCGIIFGITALAFTKSTQFWSNSFQKAIHFAPFRPMIGGVFIAAAVYFLGTTKYIGLGIPTIEAAFASNLNGYDFILKLLFTSFTLGAGFKGGEVTPLFFIGATLGNVLVWFVPLPFPLLAGIGFVAIFSGATNTPIASTFMGMELFGLESGIFIAIACSTAYLFSGSKGIYSAQISAGPKKYIYAKVTEWRKNLRKID
jgi:H+/Cl- antiporter ClcA